MQIFKQKVDEIKFKCKSIRQKLKSSTLSQITAVYPTEIPIEYTGITVLYKHRNSIYT